MKGTRLLMIAFLAICTNAYAEFSPENNIRSLRLQTNGLVSFGTGYGPLQSAL